MVIVGFVCFFIPSVLKSNIYSNRNSLAIKDSTTYEIEGVIMSKNKSLVKLKMNPTDIMPQKDQTGLLSKYFENKIGNMNLNGWLSIADIKVVSVNDMELIVSIEKELSVTYVNGEKKNHFKAGNQIKVTWVVRD
jgi:hypothetical protein